jgi:hypothetical protein
VATVPADFNSRLAQPLFTDLANLLQNTRRATERLGTAEFRTQPSRNYRYTQGVADDVQSP